MNLTGELVAAARRLVEWSRSDLAAKVGVSTITIYSFEMHNFSADVLDLSKVRAALESAGVEFIAENGGGAGVRFRKVR